MVARQDGRVFSGAQDGGGPGSARLLRTRRRATAERRSASKPKLRDVPFSHGSVPAWMRACSNAGNGSGRLGAAVAPISQRKGASDDCRSVAGNQSRGLAGIRGPACVAVSDGRRRRTDVGDRRPLVDHQRRVGASGVLGRSDGIARRPSRLPFGIATDYNRSHCGGCVSHDLGSSDVGCAREALDLALGSTARAIIVSQRVGLAVVSHC